MEGRRRGGTEREGRGDGYIAPEA